VREEEVKEEEKGRNES
jgi:hypothetical protein